MKPTRRIPTHRKNSSQENQIPVTDDYCDKIKIEIGGLRLALRNFTADMEAKFDALEDRFCK